MVYLLLIHIASFLTWFIIAFQYTHIVLTGSAKLISLMQLLNAVSTQLKKSVSASLFLASCVGCDISLRLVTCLYKVARVFSKIFPKIIWTI